ncbi:hypothetical protein PCYB_005990, partial [Plasmodium cynomolgi strain B]
INFRNFSCLWNDSIKKILPNCEFKIKNLCDLILLKRAYDYYLFSDACDTTDEKNAQISNSGYCKYINDSETIYSLYTVKCEQDDSTEDCKEFNEFNEFEEFDELEEIEEIETFEEFKEFEEIKEFKKYVLSYISHERSVRSEDNEEDVFSISCNIGLTSGSDLHKGIYIYYHY